VVELVPAVVAVGVAVLVLAVVLAVANQKRRRFTQAGHELGEDVRTATAQLRALASVRRRVHPHGVDSP